METPKASRKEGYGEGKPPQPTSWLGERRKLPQRGPGQSLGRKRAFVHLEPVYYKVIFTGRHYTPLTSILSPLFFFPYLPFPPCLSPSLPTRSLAPFPFLP